MNSRRRGIRVLAATMLIAMACTTGAEGPPEVTLDRSACSQCRMLVSSLEFAAAARSRSDGTAKIFDDAVCLLRAPLPGSWDIWFTDHEGSGWVESSSAVFVININERTPMGGGILAFRDVRRAQAFADRSGGTVVPSFAQLQEGRS